METNHGQAMKSLLTFKFKIWCLVTLRFSTAFLLTQMKTSYFPFSTIIVNKVHERLKKTKQQQKHVLRRLQS